MNGNWLRGVLTAVGAATSAVLAPLALVLSGLLALMVLDLLAALIVNGRQRKLDPQVGYLGWRRKALTIIAILGIAVLQMVVQEVKGIALPAAETIAGGFMVIELMSLLKHASAAGVKVPFVGEALKKLPEALGVENARPGTPKPQA